MKVNPMSVFALLFPRQQTSKTHVLSLVSSFIFIFIFIFTSSLCSSPVTGQETSPKEESHQIAYSATSDIKDTVKTLVNRYKTLGKSSTLIEPLDSSNASVVLRWPESKKMLPDAPLSDLTPQESTIGTSFLHHQGAGINYPFQYSPVQRRQQAQEEEGGSSINVSPRPKLVAPYPPHPAYIDEQSINPPIEPSNEEKNEKLLEKYKKYLSFKPVDHNMFKTDGKHVATLPYAPTQPFTDLQYAIDQVRRAVLKVNPMKAMASEAYKSFSKEIKSRIKDMKGPHAYSYPPGYYDAIYDPDDNPSPSEVHPVYADSPNVTDSTLIPSIVNSTNNSSLPAGTQVTKLLLNSDESNITKIEEKPFMKYDQIIDRRSMKDQEASESRIPPPVMDEEVEKEKNLETHSFGFKVTVYRTPDNKDNVTEEIFEGPSKYTIKSDDPKSIIVSHTSPYDPLNSAASSPTSSSSSFHSRYMPKSPIVSYSTSIDPVTGLVTRKVTNSNSAELKKHQRLKEESSHDRRASAEKALKERTEIEFFEREKIFDPPPPPHPHPEVHSPNLPSDDDQNHHQHQHQQHHYEQQHHPHHPEPHPIRHPHHQRNSGFNYPSESSRKLYYQMRPTSRPSVGSSKNTTSNDLRTSGNSTAVNSTKNGKDVTNEKLSKSESINEPAYMREYGRLNEYPNPDEGIKGWKETGYKIVTEVEYLDKDAHQDKAFEARDKGKAEHVKKVLQKSHGFGSHENGGSYHGDSHSDGHAIDDSHSDVPPPPPPPPASYNNGNDHGYNDHHQPSVTYDSPDEEPKQLYHDAASSSNNKKIKLKVSNITSSTSENKNYIQAPASPSKSKSIVTHVDPPASVTFLSYQTSASKPIPSVISPENGTEVKTTHGDLPAESKTNSVTSLPPTTQATFVEIVANVTSISHDSAPASTTTDASKQQSTSTSLPEVTFRPLRKPPSPFINALHIIDSPSINLNASSSKTAETATTPVSLDKLGGSNTNNNSVTPSYSNHHKFSKLVSIEAPPSVYLEALNRMKEAKAKAEKEAREKKEREKIAWLSRLVKANAYATQPLLNSYLPYASSSNGYGQYALPNSMVSSALTSSSSSSNPLASSSTNKGSYTVPMANSQSLGDPMASLTSLLGSSTSTSGQMSSIIKNLSFSPLTSFTSYGLYPFASGSSNSLSGGNRNRSPFKRLASTLNPRRILPSVREYTKSLTNVLSPYASASNVRNTILPLTAFQNNKNRLFPVASNSDPTINSVLSLLMNHAKRMDSNSNEHLIGSQEIDEIAKEKKILSLLDTTFTSVAKDYPPVTSQSPSLSSSLSLQQNGQGQGGWSSSDASIEKKEKLSTKSAQRRQDSDDEDDDPPNSLLPSFSANNLNDVEQEETIDWGPQTGILKNTKSTLLSSEEHLKGGELQPEYPDEAERIINHSSKFLESSTHPSPPPSPVSSFNEWMKERKVDVTALKPLVRVTGSRESKSSFIPINHPHQTSQFIENSTSQPVYLKNAASSTFLADAVRQSKWIAQSPLKLW